MLEIQSSFLSVNLNKLVALMQIKAEQVLRTEYDITYSQFLVLHTINTLKSPTQQDISAAITITGAGVSKIVDTLVDSRMIIKKINNQNRRANIITLTEVGKKVIDRALIRLEKEFDKNISIKNKKVLSSITEETIINLLKTYEKK